MIIKIIRIEDSVINCSLADGQIIDIDRKWLPGNIKEGDELEFDVSVANK